MVETFAVDSVHSRGKLDCDLPPINTQRWSPNRKALVVYAVRNGAISFEEACRRYQLSAEELLGWQHAVESYGVGGLRVTRLQVYGGRSLANGWSTHDHSHTGMRQRSSDVHRQGSEFPETV